MQEVVGSIPIGSTTLRPAGLRVARRSRRVGEACPAKPVGEDGLCNSMHYVYIIRSVAHPEQEYTGATSNLKQRMADHNSGKSPHTSKFASWELVSYVAFQSKKTAYEFEKYLKSHSGRAFARKRLLR